MNTTMIKITLLALALALPMAQVSAIESKKEEGRFAQIIKSGEKHSQNIVKIAVGGLMAGVAMGVFLNFLLQSKPSLKKDLQRESLGNFMVKKGIQPPDLDAQTIHATGPQESINELTKALAPVIDSVINHQSSRKVTGFYFATLQVRNPWGQAL